MSEPLKMVFEVFGWIMSLYGAVTLGRLARKVLRDKE